MSITPSPLSSNQFNCRCNSIVKCEFISFFSLHSSLGDTYEGLGAKGEAWDRGRGRDIEKKGVVGGRRAWQGAEGCDTGHQGVTRGRIVLVHFFLAGSSFPSREHNTVATFQSSNVSVEDVFDASKKARNDINRLYL